MLKSRDDLRLLELIDRKPMRIALTISCLFLILSAGCGRDDSNSNAAVGGTGSVGNSGSEEGTANPQSLESSPIAISNSPMPDMHGIVAEPIGNHKPIFYLRHPWGDPEALGVIARYDISRTIESELVGGSAFEFVADFYGDTIAVIKTDESDYNVLGCPNDRSICASVPTGLTPEHFVQFRVKGDHFYLIQTINK